MYNISSGIFIWLFLLLTLPFGLYNNNLGGVVNLAIFLLPVGVLWVFISYFGDLLFSTASDRLVKPDPRDRLFVWLGKVALFIHLIFLSRGVLCDWQCLDLLEYGELWFAGVFLFLLTYIPFMLYAKYLYFHSLVGTSETSEGLIELRGEGKENARIEIDSLVYALADDNYIDLFCLGKNGEIEKLAMRVTMKSLLSQLEQYPQFIRIHRSTLVNLKYVLRSEAGLKPLKNLSIKAQDHATKLPVSKSYQDKVAYVLTHPKN